MAHIMHECPYGPRNPAGNPGLIHCIVSGYRGRLEVCRKEGGTSCLEPGGQCPPCGCGASTLPRLLPSSFGLLFLAVNMKITSKVDLCRTSWICGKRRCCLGEGRTAGAEAGLGSGAGQLRIERAAGPGKAPHGLGLGAVQMTLL